MTLDNMDSFNAGKIALGQQIETMLDFKGVNTVHINELFITGEDPKKHEGAYTVTKGISAADTKVNISIGTYHAYRVQFAIDDDAGTGRIKIQRYIGRGQREADPRYKGRLLKFPDNRPVEIDTDSGMFDGPETLGKAAKWTNNRSRPVQVMAAGGDPTATTIYRLDALAVPLPEMQRTVVINPGDVVVWTCTTQWPTLSILVM